MPYIFLEAWYPTDLVPEVVSSNRKGIKVVSITEVKEGKLQEALTWVGTRMISFQSIKGFEYKIRLWSTVVEALEPLGMSLPG